MDFFDACKYGSLDKVISLLEQGADIHADNDLALRSSAVNGHLPFTSCAIFTGSGC